MQQLMPQVYLKYKGVAINFLSVPEKTGVYRKRTLYVSITNIFVYSGRLRNWKSLKWKLACV
jgi:hypothetical protein